MHEVTTINSNVELYKKYGIGDNSGDNSVLVINQVIFCSGHYGDVSAVSFSFSFNFLIN